MNRNLFVYGTLMLASGHPMGLKLANEARYLGPASIGAKLYDFGKWPGLVLSRLSTDIVYGEAWTLNTLDSFRWLDDYEGIRPNVVRPEYERVERRVTVREIGVVDAFLYVYRWPIAYGRLIEAGRWTANSIETADTPVVASPTNSFT